jgi:hypothetical protein
VGDDDYTVRLDIISDCENVQPLAANLGVVSALSELGGGHDAQILGAARKHLKGCCAACVAPPGIFKAMQVAAGVALPAESNIQVELSD